MQSETEPRGHPVVAAVLDAAMWPLRKVRKQIVPQAAGRVLEIGVGTGANFPYYRDADSLAGVEPDPHMLRRARRRAESISLDVDLSARGAEQLPYDDASFDTVVATWVLCTIPDPEAALAEMRRVLRPRGTLLFAEHTRSPQRLAARVQGGLSPCWSRLAGGCRLDRDSIAMIRDAGFEDVVVEPAGRERFTLTPVYLGTARRPDARAPDRGND